MEIEILLNRISDISKKYDFIYQKTGRFFNIFEIASIEADEVTLCRIIHELINPKGSHYQGDTYLRFFVEKVLKMDFTEEDYKNVNVHREYIISNNRRIDLVIETKDRFIPIEVKIYAGDQKKQCSDYYKAARNSKVFYLTIDGHVPSKESAEGLTAVVDNEGKIIEYTEVCQISFREEIAAWINRCLEHQETIMIAPIREILLQFMAVIRKLTNQMEEGKEMEIASIIASSKEHMKSAVEIESSLKVCKIEMMKKTLKEIEKAISKTKLINEYDYEFDNGKLVNSYYDKKTSTYPGISYFCKNLNKPGVDLWLRVEIDSHIYVGICTPLNGKSKGSQLTNGEVEKALPDFELRRDGWWIYWEYLPKDNKSFCPNFKEFNDEYFNLFDKDKFEDFIQEAAGRINNVINKICQP